MTGLLALVGGGEHTPGCEPIDDAVLAGCRANDPVVAILPLASSRRVRPRTVGRAVAWWEARGARPVVAPPDLRRAARILAAADVMVLPGGTPDRLHRALAASPIGELVLHRWRAGAALVGSSSGAMVLGEWRQSVLPPFGVREGFGALRHVAIAPHHDLPTPRAVAALRARTHPHAVVVGIDEATALVGRDGRFAVLGRRGVTVRRGTWERTWHTGAHVDLTRMVPETLPRSLVPVRAGTGEQRVPETPDRGLVLGSPADTGQDPSARGRVVDQ